MNTLTLLRGLRFVDSFFPSGGYAFSSGLETAVQQGAVRHADDLNRYVATFLTQGAARCDAVAVSMAHAAATTGDLTRALNADHELEAIKTCQETRAASRQMGRQVMRVAGEQRSGDSAILAGFGARVDAEQTPGHLAVCLGLILGSQGWDRQDAIAIYLYQTAIGFASAALKLMPIGQHTTQRLLEGWLPLIDHLSREAERQPQISCWTPLHDIYAMRHARLTTRLFRS